MNKKNFILFFWQIYVQTVSKFNKFEQYNKIEQIRRIWELRLKTKKSIKIEKIKFSIKSKNYLEVQP